MLDLCRADAQTLTTKITKEAKITRARFFFVTFAIFVRFVVAGH
jgi:hypothetical protein